MNRRILPGLLGYTAMAMWLLIAMAPARAAQTPEQTNEPRAQAPESDDPVKAALIAAGAPRSARIEYADPAIVGALASAAIESAGYNAATGRFVLRMRRIADGAPFVATGTALDIIMAPAPARTIARNDIITEADIVWIETNKTRNDLYADDIDTIIGRTSRRPLEPGAPFRKADLVSPTLIKRGATTTIVLEGPGIRLTQMAVALGNGGEGDLIAFRNINSDREIKAVVTGENMARAPFAPRTSLASLSTAD